MGKRRSLWLFSLLCALHMGSSFNSKKTFKACRTCDCRFSKFEVTVRCKGKHLDRIPSGLPPNTTILDLSDNVLSSLPAASLSNLTYLRYLYLQNNRIQRLSPGIFKHLKYLHTLNLDLNDISTIAKADFTALHRLEYLNICCNQISDIESESFPESLLNLDLHDNLLRSVPTKALNNIRKLEHLDLDVNPITYIQNKAFEGLQSLSDLSIKWDRIQRVEHQAFYGLPRLRQLSLVNVTLKRFPNLTGANSLQFLTLDYNEITTFPTNFCEMLPKLKKLSAEMNRITGLPDMSKCSSLEYINLDHNHITSIDLQGMTNLEKVSLKDNRISYISKNTFKGNNKLSNLNLRKNRLTSLPTQSFKDLGKLQILDLEANSIKEIDDDTFNGLNKSLTQLNLRRNNLLVIPTQALKHLGKLQNLHLDGNPIKEIHNYTFEGLTRLQEFSISWEKVKQVDHRAFIKLPSLKRLSLVNVNLTHFPDLTGTNALQVLILESNNISSLPDDFCKMFPELYNFNANVNRITSLPDMSNCTSMVLLHLAINRISSIGTSLQGMSKLKDLNLKRNNLTSIPTQAFKHLGKLQKLDLRTNPIKEIHNYAFEGLTSLQELSISWEKIERVDHGAFKKLPSLVRLFLVNINLKRFPDLTGTNALQELNLELNSISSLPEDFCKMFPKLYNFNANMNRITSLPEMSNCTSMVLLHLVFNRITSIGTSLQGMSKLQDITLKGNALTEIPSGAFTGNRRLKYLNLARNKIEKIADDAFVPLESLEKLDLSYNDFVKLPTKGMQRVRELKLRGNKRLSEISAESLPNVRLVEASYPYHCCQFRKKINSVALAPVDKTTSVTSKGWTWQNFEGMNFLIEGSANETVMLDGDDELSGFGSAPIDPAIALDREEPETERPTRPPTDSSLGSDTEILSDWKSPPLDVNCTPLPDPFFPCEDLMGSWWLRVGVWFVFMLALLGNAVVVIVIVLSQAKVDVSKFLIINLAVADLCMGIYLGCLAIVDASTIGNFMHHGVDWQQSSGCKTAGFLAVLSSEASVFTLAVITIERYIAIRHALHVERKMSLRKTAIVMAGGWFLAFIIATLPLVKVSDYSKFSICLPFETGDEQSLAFVTLLLSFNFIAFVVIFGCYVRIYFEIRGSNAWNTSDTQVALRMALLVVTDFMCWAPIVTIALPAAFGSTFVSLEQAKVFTVFVFPLNSCANPFLYAIFTYQFKKDCLNICRRVKNSPVPPVIQISLTKKRLSMSGNPAELRQGSRASVLYAPETHSDGRMTLRVPSFKLSRRYSLPAAFKLATGSIRGSAKSSGAEYSDNNDNSKCSNENTTKQTTLSQEIPRQSNVTDKVETNDISTNKNTQEQKKEVTKEKPVLIDRRTAV